MTGSNPFSIEPSDNFKRSFKKLAKAHGDSFVERVTEILEHLTEEPYPINSRTEPLPRNIQLPEGWTFHKLAFKVSKGASGQIRLMYMVNMTASAIRLVWIYSHEQFAKRPADQDMARVIKEILEA
ncbi:hypothetical protein [Kamptonema formosum]|uniref:hypothetical protein n=1 Tax=Kamptonema formosum TaxID=331992 RepID=UPI00034C61C4|nr:hypothetical protein [Oscillatoria sp. PCC 10802]